MRRRIIAGNWKMNLGPKAATGFLNEFIPQIQNQAHLEWVIFPPYVTLPAVKNLLEKSFIKYGAQNCSPKPEGALTGEISLPMISEMGCKYVLVGHSERRQVFGETDAQCAEKIKAITDQGLTPMYCVGETQKQRDAGETEKVLQKQILEGLSQWDPSQPLVIAYEPVWAIGTGKVATPQMAEEAHGLIRQTLAGKFGAPRSAEIAILYGGSVKPENSPELAMQKNIDGFLVGGASLQPKSFAQIGLIPL